MKILEQQLHLLDQEKATNLELFNPNQESCQKNQFLEKVYQFNVMKVNKGKLGAVNGMQPETDGYQQSAYVTDVGYHLPVFQHEVSPLFFPSMDGSYPPQTFYSPGWQSIPAFNTDNIIYGNQFQHPGSLYQQVPYPESQYWSFPPDVPPAEAIIPGLEDFGIHGSYFNNIQFGDNNFFGSRPRFI